MGTAHTAAFIVSLVAKHVFRTYGHYYITNDVATYAEREVLCNIRVHAYFQTLPTTYHLICFIIALYTGLAQVERPKY